MISAQQAEKSPSAHVRKRAGRMKVKMLSPSIFLVTPSEKGKAQRIVDFYYIGEGRPIRIDCFERNTKKSCLANIHGRRCSHVEAAVRALLKRAAKFDGAEASAKQKQRHRELQDYAQRVIDETEQPNLKGITK